MKKNISDEGAPWSASDDKLRKERHGPLYSHSRFMRHAFCYLALISILMVSGAFQYFSEWLLEIALKM